MKQHLASMLAEDGLKFVGHITDIGDVQASLSQECSWTGGVYAWVAMNEEGDPVYIRYVGRHSKTLASRQRQHSYGFRSVTGSKTGQKNASKIRADLESNASAFGIYAVYSDDPKSTEASLMQRYGSYYDLWNVAGKRKNLPPQMEP